MIKESIAGINGYDIPCISNLTGKERAVVICSHGFGSGKESPTILALSEALIQYGIGTYAFDFPAHGDSLAEGENLRIKNCLDDLAAVEAHVCEIAPKAEIGYFSSSFGAYINLIYLAQRPHAGKKSFLRCAAVNMPDLFNHGTTPEQYADLKAQGFCIVDHGYLHPLKITTGFYKDLAEHDVFQICRRGMAKIKMIHGDADETASVEDALDFANRFGASIEIVKGADHSFTNPGGLERVIESAIGFFVDKQQ